MGKVKYLQIREYDLFALGITIVIGGQYFGWNAGLVAGFGSFAVATLFMSISYIFLCFCISEVTSAAPFAGGSYGLARCTLGNHLGFFVGAAECCEYILYVSTSVFTLGSIIVEIEPSFSGYEPIIWLVFFATAMAVFSIGQRSFWTVNIILAVASIVILLVFCFGSFKFTDFDKNSSSPSIPMFRGGMSEYMRILPLPAWFYVGVESVSFAVNNSTTPKTSVPYAQLACVFTLFATMMLVLFTSVSLPAGIDQLSGAETVFGFGFTKMFSKLSTRMAIALSVPATYATAFGFMFPYSALLSAMAESRLLPNILNMVCNEQKLFGLAIGSTFAYVVCLVMFYVPWVSAGKIFNVCMLFGFTAYIAQCVGFIHLRLVFPNLQRPIKSPVGIFGASFALCYFFLGVISIIAFQNDRGFAIIAYTCLFAIVTVYYYTASQYTQVLSEDEKAMLYFAKERDLLNVGLTIRKHIQKRLGGGNVRIDDEDYADVDSAYIAAALAKSAPTAAVSNASAATVVPIVNGSGAYESLPSGSNPLAHEVSEDPGVVTDSWVISKKQPETDAVSIFASNV